MLELYRVHIFLPCRYTYDLNWAKRVIFHDDDDDEVNITS